MRREDKGGIELIKGGGTTYLEVTLNAFPFLTSFASIAQTFQRGFVTKGLCSHVFLNENALFRKRNSHPMISGEPPKTGNKERESADEKFLNTHFQ